jgi:hypothetical protein
MECDLIRPRLAESLTGASELPPGDHLAGCAPCRAHLDDLRSIEERLGELPRILPRFSERALPLELRPAPSRSGRAAATLAAAAAILMTLTFFLRPSPPPETAASRLAPRVQALVQAMLDARGEARELLVLDLMNLGPDALPLLEPQVPKTPELAEVVAVLVAAQETRVTVTTTSGETLNGLLVTSTRHLRRQTVRQRA